jgi:hypothetical protein
MNTKIDIKITYIKITVNFNILPRDDSKNSHYHIHEEIQNG